MWISDPYDHDLSEYKNIRIIMYIYSHSHK